jgi:hypothetical protein
LADGTLWDIEFKANGTFYVETSKGNRVTGDWKSEQGKLCSWTRNTGYRCGDAMLFQDFLYVKRADGEVIKYVPK